MANWVETGHIVFGKVLVLEIPESDKRVTIYFSEGVWKVFSSVLGTNNVLSATTEAEAKKEALRLVFNELQAVVRTIHTLIGDT